MLKWIALLSLAGLAAAQNVTFQTGARLVTTDVIVRNDDGPVKGLTKDDFTLEDKGKKVDIALFEVTEAGKFDPPVQIGPAVGSNRINSQGQVQQTATVVVYDRINVAASAQAFIRNQVLDLLINLKDGERVGFYSLGFGLQMVRDYDEDAGPLARVAKVMKDGGTPAAGDEALFKALNDGLTPMQGLANQARVNITYPAFKAIAHHLEGLHGRKNVLWIASNFPLTYGSGTERRSNDQKEHQAFIDVLADANISLYTVDPGGAGTALDTAEDTTGNILERVKTNQLNSLAGNQGFRNAADALGGKAYFNTNNITPALQEVVSLAEYNYTLGFYADEKQLDGKYHKLEVKLAKKPETDHADVSYRKQYLAWGEKNPPPPTLASTIGEYMGEATDATGVTLMGVANPQADKPGYTQLVVRVAVSELKFEPVGDMFVGAFDMAVGIEGAKGGTQETFNLNWNQQQYQQAVTSGLDVGKSIETKDGSGRFVVVIQDKATGKAGRVRIPFGPATAAQ